MMNNATAAEADADDADQESADEAVFAADAEDELRAAEEDGAEAEELAEPHEDVADADTGAVEEDDAADPELEGADADDMAAEKQDAPDLPPDEDDVAPEPEAAAAPDRDAWRSRAAQLLGAGLASHVIALSDAAAEDESAALGPMLDFASGALFRLGPARFAAMLDDPEAAADALGADAMIDVITDIDAPEAPTAAACAPEALVLVAPLTAAALCAGGSRVVIDAEFALEVATRTAEGIARIVAAADTGGAPAQDNDRLDALEARLVRMETAQDAILAAVTAGGGAVQAPFASGAQVGVPADLTDRIDAGVDRAVAAVRADILKSARARRDADRRALEPMLERLGAAAEALEQDRAVSAGRTDAYAETIRVIIAEVLARVPGAGARS
jgi:hypothetical protein